jgi:hypothetical protein
MSHRIADVQSKSVSKEPTKGFTLATKIKKGKSIECVIDSSDGRYISILKIESVTITPSGKFVHLDVGADEPIEFKSTDYIKLI